MTTGTRNWQTHCTTCDEYVAANHEGKCAWCGGAVRTKFRKRRPEQSPPWLMTPQLIDACVAAYKAGHSVRQIALATMSRTGYASIESYQGALRAQLHRRNIPVRTAGVARGIALRRRAMARIEGLDVGRRCTALNRAGVRCLMDAIPERDVCYHHAPDRSTGRRAAGLLAQRRLRARRALYSEFADKIDAWADAHGRYGWKATARKLVGISGATIGSLQRSRATGEDRWLTPQTEAKLRRLLAHDPKGHR